MITWWLGSVIILYQVLRLYNIDWKDKGIPLCQSIMPWKGCGGKAPYILDPSSWWRWMVSCSTLLPLGKVSSYLRTYWIEGWVGSKAGMDVAGKTKIPDPGRNKILVIQHVSSYSLIYPYSQYWLVASHSLSYLNSQYWLKCYDVEWKVRGHLGLGYHVTLAGESGENPYNRVATTDSFQIQKFFLWGFIQKSRGNNSWRAMYHNISLWAFMAVCCFICFQSLVTTLICGGMFCQQQNIPLQYRVITQGCKQD